MTDPTTIPWGTIAASGATAVVSLLASNAALAAFVVRLLKENGKLKSKRRVLVRNQRAARVELERRELGHASVRPPSENEFDDDSAVIDAIEGEDLPVMPKLTRIEPGFPGIPRSIPLDGFGGQQDHEDWRRRQKEHGEDTPTEVPRRGKR